MVFLGWQIRNYRTAWPKAGIQWLLLMWFGGTIVTGGLCLKWDWTSLGCELKKCPNF